MSSLEVSCFDDVLHRDPVSSSLNFIGLQVGKQNGFAGSQNTSSIIERVKAEPLISLGHYTISP